MHPILAAAKYGNDLLNFIDEYAGWIVFWLLMFCCGCAELIRQWIASRPRR